MAVGCAQSRTRRRFLKIRAKVRSTTLRRGSNSKPSVWPRRMAARIDDPRQGVSQADVYQMMGYGRLYRCDCLTLLYPHHPALGVTDGVVASHRVNGSDHRLETATIDLAASDGFAARLLQILIREDATRVTKARAIAN